MLGNCVKLYCVLLVVQLAENTLGVLTKMKAGKSEKTPKGKWQARKEVKKLFNYSGAKRKKREEGGAEWKHKFFCLAFHDQRRIPTTDVEKDDLLQAGLGEKEIWVNNLEMNAEEFRDLLYFHYPQLCKAGGFRLCKCKPNSRDLEEIEEHLKECETIQDKKM